MTLRDADRSSLTQNGRVAPTPGSAEARADRLASREGGLWRLALLVLMILALGLAAISWNQIRDRAPEWAVLPIGLVVLVALFGFYVFNKVNEISELRGLVRGLEQRVAAPPDMGQLEKLFGMVERSQQGYRDLIDTFEDLLFSVSTEGTILAANRSFADLIGRSFGELMGRPLDEFIDIADGTGREVLNKVLPHLLERRHWFGVLHIRLKRDSSARFFQCTVHALVRVGQDRGICVLARDITRERENEARFTELFETLQEGVYLAGADGRFEDVNPALARMLGYENREDLLNHPLSEFVLFPEQWEAEERQLANTGAINGYEVTLRRRDGSASLACTRPRSSATPRGRSAAIRERSSTSPSAAKWNCACIASRSSPAAWSRASQTWSSPPTARDATPLSVRGLPNCSATLPRR